MQDALVSMGTFASILVWIITGGIAGYAASLLLRTERQGCFLNVGLGIVGAIVGALLIRFLFPGLLNLFGTGAIAGIMNQIFHSVFGAIVLLVVWEIIMPGRQLGVRERGKKKKR